MNHSTRDTYLATEVMTAAPPKLQLMLIEAAIRFAGRTRQFWAEQKDAEAGEALLRAQDIAGELVAALDHEAEPELAARAGAVYLFVFRCLVEAGFQRNPAKLDDAIKVLEVERDTWRRVCEKFGARSDIAHAPTSRPHDDAARVPLADSSAGLLDPPPAGGFSLEA